MMDIKKRILELMEERHWTRYKLAHEAGLYITTINAWFDKNYNPSMDSIQSVCNAFGITVVKFFSGVDEGKLSAEQLVILDKYNQIPENRRKLVVELLDILIAEK